MGKNLSSNKLISISRCHNQKLSMNYTNNADSEPKSTGSGPVSSPTLLDPSPLLSPEGENRDTSTSTTDASDKNVDRNQESTSRPENEGLSEFDSAFAKAVKIIIQRELIEQYERGSGVSFQTMVKRLVESTVIGRVSTVAASNDSRNTEVCGPICSSIFCSPNAILV